MDNIYYVAHAAQTTSGSLAKEFFSFENLKAAKSNHFYFLSSAYANDDLIYFLSEITDRKGAVITKEAYEIPTEETEE